LAPDFYYTLVGTDTIVHFLITCMIWAGVSSSEVLAVTVHIANFIRISTVPTVNSVHIERIEVIGER